MNFPLNRNTVKKLQAENGHSVLEYSLMELALRLYDSVEKLNADCTEMKVKMISISNLIPAHIHVAAIEQRANSASGSGVAVVIGVPTESELRSQSEEAARRG